MQPSLQALRLRITVMDSFADHSHLVHLQGRPAGWPYHASSHASEGRPGIFVRCRATASTYSIRRISLSANRWSGSPVRFDLRIFQACTRCVKANTTLHSQRFISGLAYLEQRGLCDRGLLRDLRVGYCDGEKLMAMTTNDERRLLQQAGVLNEKGREFFSRCVVFPLHDRHNRVIGFLWAERHSHWKSPAPFLRRHPYGAFSSRSRPWNLSYLPYRGHSGRAGGAHRPA